MKCTEHLTEWNVQSAIGFRNNVFFTGPPRTRGQWIRKVRCEKCWAPTDHKPQKGQEGPTRRPSQANSRSNHLRLQMTVHFTKEVTASFQALRRRSRNLYESFCWSSPFSRCQGPPQSSTYHQQLSSLVSFTILAGSDCFEGPKPKRSPSDSNMWLY